MVLTTVNAKKAFSPMPGAMPMGQLATSAMISDPSAAARQVATNTALRSMPVEDRMSGLTKMMYDIVRNVVRPATISVRALVPCSRNWNSFSSISCSPGLSEAAIFAPDVHFVAMIILGFESSCDETGVAAVCTERGLLAHALHTQIAMHREYGGVVPELASRDHIRRAVPLARQVLAEAGLGLGDV